MGLTGTINGVLETWLFQVPTVRSLPVSVTASDPCACVHSISKPVSQHGLSSDLLGAASFLTVCTETPESWLWLLYARLMGHFCFSACLISVDLWVVETPSLRQFFLLCVAQFFRVYLVHLWLFLCCLRFPLLLPSQHGSLRPGDSILSSCFSPESVILLPCPVSLALKHVSQPFTSFVCHYHPSLQNHCFVI